MCIQYKLTLQVESKHIKILEKKKQSLNQVAKFEGKKKREKDKSLNQKYCS